METQGDEHEVTGGLMKAIYPERHVGMEGENSSGNQKARCHDGEEGKNEHSVNQDGKNPLLCPPAPMERFIPGKVPFRMEKGQQ